MMIVVVEFVAVMLMVVEIVMVADESVFCNHKLNYCTVFILN
jgi:hypothetical protein